MKGTVFVHPNVDSRAPQEWLLSNFTPPLLPHDGKVKLKRAVKTLLGLYPDDPVLGSPYGMGDETFGLDKAFKRLSSIRELPIRYLGLRG
jgi:acetylcholinesterase